MPQQVLQGVASDLRTIDEKIGTANQFLSIMKEAGENTAAMEAELRTLQIRKDKWQKVINNRIATGNQ